MSFKFAALTAMVFAAVHQVASVPLADGSIAAAWYAGWHATGVDAVPLSAVNWTLYNNMIYAFSVTTPDVNTITSDPLVSDFVSTAHSNNVKAHVSIGGWTGGRWFSSDLGSAENRTAFVRAVTNLAKESGVDGIEFDWEYPNKQGIGCNVVNSDDTQNFLSFLQELRSNVGDSLILSAATSVSPFLDASGNPSTDVSGFAKELDYIAIMNYDIWGSWSSAVGPNAPLDDSCAPSGNQQGSAKSGVKAWTAAGMPASQIVLGVPSYGHSFGVSVDDAFVEGSRTELAPYPPFVKSNQPLGDPWDDQGGDDACGAYQGPGGTFNLWGLVDGGFLDANGNPLESIAYRYDSCSQTPYVYNPTSEVMVSYDNVKSFAAKGNYIQQAGLKGFAMWQTGGDYNNLLVQSIRSAVGF